jgi:hypothetical protein
MTGSTSLEILNNLLFNGLTNQTKNDNYATFEISIKDDTYVLYIRKVLNT